MTHKHWYSLSLISFAAVLFSFGVYCIVQGALAWRTERAAPDAPEPPATERPDLRPVTLLFVSNMGVALMQYIAADVARRWRTS